MRRPYNGSAKVTRAYGVVDAVYANYPSSKHPGTDYGIVENYPLVAAISGKVTTYPRGNTKTGRGNEIVITNGSTQVKYCHLNQIDVANGSVVTEGQQIGLTGWTGYVLPKSPEGSHLHFEVLKDGSYVDPETQYNQGGEMPITKEQEQVLSILATGSRPGSAYDYRFTGKVADQTTVDQFVNFWNEQSKTVGLQKRVTELGKAIAIKGKEIESLKSQVGDNTKWNTLKALIRELVGAK